MRRIRTTGWIVVGLALLPGVGGYLFFAGGRSAPQKPRQADLKEKKDRVGPPHAPAAAEQNASGSVSPASDDTLRQAITRQMVISKLLEAYGNHIYHPRIQLQAIQKLIAYLKQIYPDTWREHVNEYLSAAFPDEADALYVRFLTFEEDQQWLRDDYRTIIAMPAGERNAYLWAKRKLFFGEDAAVIWARELQEQQVADAVGEIDQLEQASFEDKVAYFNFRLEDIYAEEYEAYKRKDPQKMMDRFLSSESVQQDLQAMPADQRRKSLEELRRSMGLDDAALERWAALDATRGESWRLGETYMQRRAQIVSAGSGAEQSSKLDALRKELFGPEADTIKDEEATGFFRFKRKRVDGQN